MCGWKTADFHTDGESDKDICFRSANITLKRILKSKNVLIYCIYRLKMVCRKVRLPIKTVLIMT